jgi:hypothetical protein
MHHKFHCKTLYYLLRGEMTEFCSGVINSPEENLQKCSPHTEPETSQPSKAVTVSSS